MIGGLARFGAPGKPADGVLWVPTSTPSTKKIESALRLGRPLPTPGKRTCRSPASRARRPRSRSTSPRTTRSPATKSTTSRSMPKTTPRTSSPASSTSRSLRPARRSTARRWSCGLLTATGAPRAGSTAHGSRRPSASASRRDCWIRRQSFFQMTMFELPEGTINYRFKDIPQWAKDAKDHGINAVQISGWQLGGHDNGYPRLHRRPASGHLAGTWRTASRPATRWA